MTYSKSHRLISYQSTLQIHYMSITIRIRLQSHLQKQHLPKLKINLKSSHEKADINIIKQFVSCADVGMKNLRIILKDKSVSVLLNACVLKLHIDTHIKLNSLRKYRDNSFSKHPVVVITIAKLQSIESELTFCTGSNATCDVSDIRNGVNL